MKKCLASTFFALVLGLFIANAVISPVILPVYAAEQTTTQDQSQQQPDTKKKDDAGGHSGHHG
ncbi:hypothetical protein SCACP_28210 [Sporomusa carbonis]